MKLYKRIILTILMGYVGSAYTNRQPLNLNVHNAISDTEFDMIVTNSWGKLSFADKEKMGQYLLCKLQDTQLDKKINILAKMSRYQKHLKNMRHETPTLPLDATDRHIIRYHTEIQGFLKKHNISTITNKAYKMAKELEDDGYAVFFHGQQWSFALLQKIYKDLYQAHYGVTVPDDFTFIHFKSPNRFYNQQEEDQKRTTILKRKNGWADSPNVLFMNKPLFGNITRDGGCSLYYFATNFSMFITSHTPQLWDIFSYFGASNLYNKYRPHLDKLEKLHRDATAHGNLLLIAVPKNLADDCIFKTVEHNKDQREYCLVMTHDIALNPDSGIKMYPFNKLIKDKHATFEKEYKKLMTRIKNDMSLHGIRMA